MDNARPLRRRTLVGSSGLLELMILLMVAAPLAVWSTAAWTSAAAASPPIEWRLDSFRRASAAIERTSSTPPIPAMGLSAFLTHDFEADRPGLRLLKDVATSRLASPGGLAHACDAAARLASAASPIGRALRLIPLLQEATSTPAHGDSIPVPPPVAPVPPSLLTPPDFGVPSMETLAASFPAPEVSRFLIRNEAGKQVAARLHGCHEGKSVLMLPDGRLGIPSMMVPTDEPFRPLSADEVAKGLQSGPFEDFKLHRTEHYLILHQSPAEGPVDDAFVRANGVLLEGLYKRLMEAFRKHDVTVHEAEFPLVAVIFKTEEDFRAYSRQPADVQAYYEIYSNRIFLYEHPSRDRIEPEVQALLKPQIVAHEGTHQVLQNIGVQPRLSEWPLWLVEGLAEYCATPASSRKGGPAWDGLGQINNLHMATLREIEDPVSLSMPGQDVRTKSLFREPGQPLVEAMIRRRELTPTEYALAWAITHYLAMKRSDDFTRFLRVMAAAPPLEPRSADDHVRAFRQAFGDDLGKLDKTIYAYLNRLTKQKGYDPMPYYAVQFEQPLPNGQLRRAAMVSQSPQLIKQWIDEMSNPAAVLPSWQATPFPSRARATLAVQDWIRGN
ncbi:DUF1570 domain-containing protein [Paludisphaera mucosa]|uniref:DUF1570 domain-containing protein n=1 Tax=Paludisphaera mucosa TaxID=3030827 RepID=A0ABT6F6P8_9BACT|nr:DUF1570 domain-containing protein [Paludisphaera mucosa]MDG3003194.1 DUF1570 domain-containing protein [Paludisphaera mucosa]